MDPSLSAAAPLEGEEGESDSGDEAGGGRTPKRRALKCRLCNGKLILNPTGLRQHVASKKHLRRCGGEVTRSSCACDCHALATHQWFEETGAFKTRRTT